MVVTVKQHQIAARQQRVGHHLVRRRGTVKDEIGFIGVEHLRRELLRVFGRPFVNQQIAKLNVGVAHVGAKDVFAKEVKELPSRRVLLKEGAVLMARAREGAVIHLNVLGQRIEERRQQVLFIAAGGGFQFEPLLLFAANDGRHAFWFFVVRVTEQINRQVEPGAFQ